MKSSFERYMRQTILPEVGDKGQELFFKTRVLVVGAGGLGCPVLSYLVGAGFGHIGIVDADRVDISNLQRQVLYREDDVGSLKVESALEALSALNGDISLKTFPVNITQENVTEIVSSYDYVMDCSDNFTTRYLLSDTCVRENKVFISGAVEGWQGQMGFYLSHQNNQGCYRCFFPDSSSTQVRCVDAGMMGPVVGTIGLWQVLTLQKYLLGMVHESFLVCYNFLTHDQKKFLVSKSCSCQSV